MERIFCAEDRCGAEPGGEAEHCVENQGGFGRKTAHPFSSQASNVAVLSHEPLVVNQRQKAVDVGKKTSISSDATGGGTVSVYVVCFEG